MKMNETLKILQILKAAYPRFYTGMSEGDFKNVVSLWHEMFKDNDINIVAAAVKALIATDAKGFPPAIGQVKEKIYQLTNAQADMTEEEAWQRVRKACSYYSSVKEFNLLPEMLQKLVGSPNRLKEWAIVPLDELETVVKSNFIRSYRAKLEISKREAMYTKDIKQLSDKLKTVDKLGLYDKFKLESGKDV